MRWFVRSIWITGLALLLTLGYLWYILLSPFGDHLPDELLKQDSGMHHRVFVYGTLTYAPVRWFAKGRAGNPTPYVLIGYERHGLDLHPRADGQVEGLLLTVSTLELRRLDRYERLGIRYLRNQIILSDGEPAWVYQRLPGDNG